MSSEPSRSRRTSPARGAVLSVAMRWSDRLLGLVSTLILARLLLPADFGLVAMAMVAVGLLDAILDLGVAAALIQSQQADRDDFDTAWTLRLIQAALVAGLLVVSAPWIADFYSDSRVTGILRVVAITVLVGGLENIGIVSFQKNMEFGRDFQFFFLRRVAGVVFTIVAALVFRSYWALVLGSLFSRVAGVGLSYYLSSFRPRLSLSRFAAIWSFSQWKVVGGVAQYLYESVDRLVVGRTATAATVGAYTVGQEIATLPTTELLAPLGRVMFPAFSEAQGDQIELRRLVLLALGVQALIGIPAGLGIALVAEDAIPLLLGGNWGEAVPFVQILALAGLATAMEHSSGYMLLAMGRIRTLSAFYWFRLAILAIAIFFLLPGFEALGVALAKLVTAVAGLCGLLWLGRKALPGLRFATMFGQVWRPLVAAAVMAAAVMAIGHATASWSSVPRLVLEVAGGAAVYGAAVLALWKLSASPVGAETYLLQKIPVPQRWLKNPTK